MINNYNIKQVRSQPKMAYVYKVIFLPTTQYYIGYRGSKKATPDDLFTTYFTSSKVIANLIKEHGVDKFSKEILAEFETGIEAYEYEQQLLREHNVEANTQMLNKRLTSCALDSFKKHTEKSKTQMSNSRKSLWEDPDYRSKVSNSIRQSWEDPDRIKSLQTDEFRLLKSQQSKKLWKDPAYLENYNQAHAKAVDDPDYRVWHSNHKTELWKDPIYKQQQNESRKKRWADPEYKKMMSDRRKAKWADPEYKAMMLASRKKS
jgi:hypothetical protein